METIITIDFDIIMWPSIELYNHIIDGYIDKIQILEQEIPLLKYANADLELYKKLTEYLVQKKKEKIPIEFIDSHEQVLNYIKTPSVVINIDHHHDLGYNEFQWDDKEIVCGNWAYKGLKNGQITNYV